MLQRYLLYNPSYSPFVPYFVAMATRIDCGRIRLAAFDGPSTKTPLQTQKFCRYLSHKPSYISQSIKTHLYSDICRERIGGAFCPKFRCHGNGGRSRVNINDIANRLTQRLTFCDVMHAEESLVCTDKLTHTQTEKSDLLISTNVHYVYLGGNRSNVSYLSNDLRS